MEKEESIYTISVLKETKQALSANNPLALLELSNKKIHSAACIQDIESITLTIVIYSLAKLIERKNNLKIKNWEIFVKKMNVLLDLSISALEKNNRSAYQKYILKAKSSLESISPSLKQNTKEIIRNACINKASHIYKHGISLGQTAKLLGITQWELAEYTGQAKMGDINYNRTLNEKSRIKMAMEFFE
ncbi:MAG: hypothetical protein Q7S27_02990 [Nanoarchaeota archaeon]|nr:hypothetical protein [Nanoarchaeota archaeon]